MREIGKYTYGGNGILVHHWNENAKLIIGKFCSISGDVEIFLGANHRVDWFTTYPFGHVNKDVFTSFDGRGHPATNGDVLIGNDVWIGKGATIMSGVQIGNGSVIGAKSLVTKNVEPYTIVGGNPAKIIRKRFSDEVISILEKISWWNWPDDKINSNITVLCSSDIEKLKTLL